MSGAGKLVQQALGSMLEILKQEVFNATTVNFVNIQIDRCSAKANASSVLCLWPAVLLMFIALFHRISHWTHLIPGEGGGVGLRPSSDQAWQRCLARRAEAAL